MVLNEGTDEAWSPCSAVFVDKKFKKEEIEDCEGKVAGSFESHFGNPSGHLLYQRHRYCTVCFFLVLSTVRSLVQLLSFSL